MFGRPGQFKRFRALIRRRLLDFVLRFYLATQRFFYDAVYKRSEAKRYRAAFFYCVYFVYFIRLIKAAIE